MEMRSTPEVAIFGGTQEFVGIISSVKFRNIIAKPLIKICEIIMIKRRNRLIHEMRKINLMSRRYMPIFVPKVPRQREILISVSEGNKTCLQTEALHRLLLTSRVIHKFHTALLTTEQAIATRNVADFARGEIATHRLDTRHNVKKCQNRIDADKSF